MIQRIQSVFLVLVIVLTATLFSLPLIEYAVDETVYVMNSYKTVSTNVPSTIVSKNIGVGATGGLVILLTAFALFLYKKRALQLKMVKFNILLIALQIAAIVLYSEATEKVLGEGVVLTFKVGALIPILSLILTYLAVRFIKKDDELVRAANRLR